ncbi:hypothetical protein BGW80DRAFT_1250817 [Lactifluus volemus]|nr:hypothetical protein BGW80DRAFT_1250817 [Lactifluus volemus]
MLPECICNGFAELSYFTDRGFYEDWVTSPISFSSLVLSTATVELNFLDEFSRKWNMPAHSFLLRHVYPLAISSYQFSLSRAIPRTGHGRSHQEVTIPIIAVARAPAIKRNKFFGNAVGVLRGFPVAVRSLRIPRTL